MKTTAAEKYQRMLERQRRYYQEHREERLAYSKRYWQEVRDGKRKPKRRATL